MAASQWGRAFLAQPNLWFDKPVLSEAEGKGPAGA